MAIKNFSLVLISVLVLLFSSCSLGGDAKTSGLSIGGGGSSSEKGVGVELEFGENRPPQEVMSGTGMTFAFIFKNYQAHDINDLKVQVGGFDKSYVSGLSQSYNIKSIKKYDDVTGPGVYDGLYEDSVSVDGFAGDNWPFTPIFTYCYSSKSVLREQVCVRQNQESCSNFKNQIYSNGPIKISLDNVNDYSENEVILEFSVKNTGAGEIVEQCFAERNSYLREYEVNVKIGETNVKCEPKNNDEFGITNDGQGAGYFTCSFNKQNGPSYVTQMIAELDYKYEQNVQKSINVKNRN